jgi:hypothetical protein
MSFTNGGRIVTDGLVLSLDAADQNSYISGSTTWNDLSGNNSNGTLQSTPSYSSDSYGGITFLSTGQYISTNLTVPSPLTRATTYEIAFIPATGSISTLSGLMGYGGYNTDGFHMGLNGSSLVSMGYSGSVSYYNGFALAISYSSVNVITVVYESRKNTYYRNGSIDSIQTYSFDTLPSSTPIRIGGYTQGGWPQSKCTVFYARAYNRALSASEVLQNYNAQKSRFNLT